MEDGREIKRQKTCVVVDCKGIIKDKFWTKNSHILNGE